MFSLPSFDLGPVVVAKDPSYGHANGAFFTVKAAKDQDSDSTFTVIATPIGATKTGLRGDAETKYAGGQNYSVYDET